MKYAVKTGGNGKNEISEGRRYLSLTNGITLSTSEERSGR
jgi:hypothetical protein